MKTISQPGQVSSVGSWRSAAPRRRRSCRACGCRGTRGRDAGWPSSRRPRRRCAPRRRSPAQARPPPARAQLLAHQALVVGDQGARRARRHVHGSAGTAARRLERRHSQSTSSNGSHSRGERQRAGAEQHAPTSSTAPATTASGSTTPAPAPAAARCRARRRRWPGRAPRARPQVRGPRSCVVDDRRGCRPQASRARGRVRPARRLRAGRGRAGEQGAPGGHDAWFPAWAWRRRAR